MKASTLRPNSSTTLEISPIQPQHDQPKPPMKKERFKPPAWIILLLLCANPLSVESSAQVFPYPEEENTTPPSLQIMPIANLTKWSHSAPEQLTVPIGTQLHFWQASPRHATVSWIGAQEIERLEHGSKALILVDEVGDYDVRASISFPHGAIHTQSCSLNVVDVPAEEIRIATVKVHKTNEVRLGPDTPNAVVMDAYFGTSIASVLEMGTDAYLTSIDCKVTLKATTDPPGFEDLIEWRLEEPRTLFQSIDQLGEDFEGPQLGASHSSARLGGSVDHSFQNLGTNFVHAGPPFAERTLTIETFSTTIHYYETEILDDLPVTLHATTNPPGYENVVTWLASTKFGTATPTMGTGPLFSVTYSDTTGPGGERWIGIRADNTVQGSDSRGEIIGDVGGVALPRFTPTGSRGAGETWCNYVVTFVTSGNCSPYFRQGDSICIRCPGNKPCPPTPCIGICRMTAQLLVANRPVCTVELSHSDSGACQPCSSNIARRFRFVCQ